jgi:SnoaL-like protein
MTAEEERNLRLAKQYEVTYNTDIIRFIHECYTPDCVVNDGLIEGYEKFEQVEKSVLAAAPKRKMRVDSRYAVGNVVIVQAVLLDPDRGPEWKLPFCAVLTCRDGKIANDYTYAEFKKWPGSASW